MRTLTSPVTKYSTANMLTLSKVSKHADILWFLSQSKDENVRKNVAANVFAEPGTLEALSKDSSSGVRLFVASNPSTPDHVLETLYGLGYIGLDLAIAGNPNLGEKLAVRIAHEGTKHARRMLAANPSLINYSYLVKVLRRDENPMVVEAIENNCARDFLDF